MNGLMSAGLFIGAVSREIADQMSREIVNSVDGGDDMQQQDDTMVPCDMCDTMVRFSDYLQHSRTCPGMRRPLLPVATDQSASDEPASDEPSIWNRSALASAPWLASSDDSGDDDSDDDAEADADAYDVVYTTFVRHAREHLTQRMLQRLMEHGIAPTPSHEHTVIEIDAPFNLLQRLVFMSSAADDGNNYDLNSRLGELMGSVEIGVSDIDQVTTVAACEDDDAACAICQDSIGAGTPQRTTLCGHVYCSSCLEQWFKSSKRCPVCMCDVDELLASKEK